MPLASLVRISFFAHTHERTPCRSFARQRIASRGRIRLTLLNRSRRQIAATLRPKAEQMIEELRQKYENLAARAGELRRFL